MPRGVAPLTASTCEKPQAEEMLDGALQSVIMDGKDTNRNTRAAMAGLKTFCPRPPKVILTTPMAKIEPMTATHQGQEAGRLRASSKPVTAAEPSRRVEGVCCRKRSMAYSVSIQAQMQTATSRSSAQP